MSDFKFSYSNMCEPLKIVAELGPSKEQGQPLQYPSI